MGSNANVFAFDGLTSKISQQQKSAQAVPRGNRIPIGPNTPLLKAPFSSENPETVEEKDNSTTEETTSLRPMALAIVGLALLAVVVFTTTNYKSEPKPTQPTATSPQVFYTIANSHVRSCPFQTCVSLGIFAAGMPVSVIGEATDHSWYEISWLEEGTEKRGWIFKSLLTSVLSPTTKDATAQLPGQTRQVESLKQELKKITPRARQQEPSPRSTSVSDIVRQQGQYVFPIGCLRKDGDENTGSSVLVGTTYSRSDQTKYADVLISAHHLLEGVTPIETAEVIALFGDAIWPCWIEKSSDHFRTAWTDLYLVTPVYFPSAMTEGEAEQYDFFFFEVSAKISTAGDGSVIPNASLVLGSKKPHHCLPEDVQPGKAIIILGYPSVGGDMLTVTEGIISGFDGAHFKTSAKIEQGNSGGGAFLIDNGCWVGIPVFARVGVIESIGRILSVPFLDEHYISQIWNLE